MTRDEAIAILGKTIQDDGTLQSDEFSIYVAWDYGQHHVVVDGAFLPEYLEAIALWMRQDHTDRHSAAVEQSFKNNRGEIMDEPLYVTIPNDPHHDVYELINPPSSTVANRTIYLRRQIAYLQQQIATFQAKARLIDDVVESSS